MAEIAAGQFAQATGTVAAIRSTGGMLVRDHTAFDAMLVHVATELKVSLVTSLTVQQTEIGDRLSAENGPGFDHDFTASMMSGHQTMIAATGAEILHGSSPRVTALARQALPVLEKHLRMLRAVAGAG
jgi:putative membrane protein